jgi:hypothetical protein
MNDDAHLFDIPKPRGSFHQVNVYEDCCLRLSKNACRTSMKNPSALPFMCARKSYWNDMAIQMIA